MRTSTHGFVYPMHHCVWAAAVCTAILGCSPDETVNALSVDFDVEVIPSDRIASVVTVSWTIDKEDVEDAWIQFGRDDVTRFRAPGQVAADGAFEATLIGMKPSTEYGFQAVVVLRGVEFVSELYTVTTGGGRTDIPTASMDEDVYDPQRASGGFVYTTLIPGPSIILDADGDTVWWHSVSQGDGHVIARTHPGEGSRHVLYETLQGWTTAGEYSEVREVIRAGLDGEYAQRVPVPYAHHDFLELPDGTLALLEFDRREMYGVEVDGDRLVELDVDGARTEIWNIWDHTEYDPDHDHDGGARWGHCNAIDYDPSDDAYLVGCLHFNCIFKVDRATGAVVWTMGGADSDFEIVGGEEEWFWGQHQFQFFDGGMVVFNNGPYGGFETCASEFAVDYDTFTVERIWDYYPDPRLGIYAYGDASRLPNGNTLITWSSAGQMDEVTPQGEVVWRLNLDLGAGFGYAVWRESLYETP